jgi:hypothetical protein
MHVRAFLGMDVMMVGTANQAILIMVGAISRRHGEFTIEPACISAK